LMRNKNPKAKLDNRDYALVCAADVPRVRLMLCI
jgi:ribosomal protein L35